MLCDRRRLVRELPLVLIMTAMPYRLTFDGRLSRLEAHAQNRGPGRGGSKGNGKAGSGGGNKGSGDKSAIGRKNGVTERDIEVVHKDGVLERIVRGLYEMRDRQGRRIIQRRATAKDRSRLQKLRSSASHRRFRWEALRA